MGMLSNLRSKVVTGSAVGIVLSALSLYYDLHGNHTHLTMEIVAESNVLDVKHPIPDLAILFQGKDVEEEKSNLKILTVRVANDGTANIRQDDFDSRIPFGMQISGGRIVRAQVIGSNSPYLSENIHPTVVGTGQVSMDKIIFDKGKFVSLEILVLHPKSTNPQLSPMGKIAGLDEISVINFYENRDQPSLLAQAFSGPVSVQICRIVAYSLSGLIFVIAIGFGIAGVSSMLSKIGERRRKRIAGRMQAHESPDMERKRLVIEKIYVRSGADGLETAQRLLSDEDSLRRTLISRRLKLRDVKASDLTEPEMEAMRIHTSMESTSVLAPLITAKLITLRRGDLTIDPDIKPLLNDFIDQLKAKSQ